MCHVSRVCYQRDLPRLVLDVFKVIPIHLDKFYSSLGFFGVFSDTERFFFLFLRSFYQKKKNAALGVFFHNIGPNWPIRQTETTVFRRSGREEYYFRTLPDIKVALNFYYFSFMPSIFPFTPRLQL